MRRVFRSRFVSSGWLVLGLAAAALILPPRIGAAPPDPVLWAHSQELVDPALADSTYVGISVAVSGDTVVAGSYTDDGGRGVVHAFARDPVSGIWAHSQRLVDPAGDADDQLGFSVAIEGDTLVAGAPGGDVSGISPGSAHVFTLEAGSGTWSHDEIFAGTLTNGDRFGSSVALSRDILVVGAIGASESGNEAGAAHVFTRHPTSGLWSYVQELRDPQGAAGDEFGFSVAVWEDTIAVGARGDDDAGENDGAIHVFTLDTGSGTWEHAQRLTAPAGGSGELGYSLALDGWTIAAGAPFLSDSGVERGAVHLFAWDPDSGLWSHAKDLRNPAPGDGDRFGYSVALEEGTLVVGAKNDDGGAIGSGTVQVFELEAGSWTHVQELTEPNPAVLDSLGDSVGVSGDTVVAGAPFDDGSGENHGALHVWAHRVARAAGLPVGIPDASAPDVPGVVSSTVTVSDLRTVVDVDVAVTIDHDWVVDLELELSHDDTGRTAVLVNRAPCGAADIDAVLDDEGWAPVHDECAPAPPAIAGRLIPFEPLSVFEGLPGDGSWTLTVKDHAQVDAGVLQAWELRIQFDESPPAISGMPDDLLVEATGPYGAVASWAAPTAIDGMDGVVPVDCFPASGMEFGFGDTEVLCAAWDSSGNFASRYFRVTVIDADLPTVGIAVPADGATYEIWSSVFADYSCSDSGSGVASCTGPVPQGGAIDTNGLGVKSFVVAAEDFGGNEAVLTHVYWVVDTVDPEVWIDVPADGAVYQQGEAVVTSAGCNDFGSGIADCHEVPFGDLLDTSAPGTHEFTVVGTDEAGNTASVTHSYRVVLPCGGMRVTLEVPPGGAPFRGTKAQDVILGTEGPDTIYGLGGHDVICGLGGDDVLLGGPGDDRLFGGDGKDKLRGAGGEDQLWGGPGSDRLLPEAGDDRVDGGPGSDIVDYLAAGGPVEVYLDSGLARYSPLTGETWQASLFGIEKVDGSAFDDYIAGDERRNVLRGKQGDDVIVGAGGDDDLIGGTGVDSLWGRSGDDLVKGQADDDLLNGEEGSDRLVGGNGNDWLSGGAGDDVLIGGLKRHLGTLVNTLDGGDATDTCRWEAVSIDCNP